MYFASVVRLPRSIVILRLNQHLPRRVRQLLRDVARDRRADDRLGLEKGRAGGAVDIFTKLAAEARVGADEVP